MPSLVVMNDTQNSFFLFTCVLPSFNRLEDDFAGDLKAYNDYLEQKEDLIYDMTCGTKEEMERAQAKVRAYEDAHRSEITENAAKRYSRKGGERRGGHLPRVLCADVHSFVAMHYKGRLLSAELYVRHISRLA